MAITLRPREVKDLTEWHKRHFKLGIATGFIYGTMICSCILEIATGHWIMTGLTLLVLAGMIWFYRINFADYYPETIKFMLDCVELNRLQGEIDKNKIDYAEDTTTFSDAKIAEFEKWRKNSEDEYK